MATCSTLLPGGTAEAPLQVVFFLQTLILCLVTTSIWESFRVVFSDNGWRCSWLVKNASSSRAQWTLCSGKVKSQGIKKLQVVVVEFWTLEPTMSSAIITMGRSPTACPFGRTSLSNKISSWFFFSLFPLQVQQQRVHTRSPHTSRRHGTILGHLSPPGVVRAISINAAANR